jgi:hypothetical protein
MTLQEAAAQAILVQDACNMSGVLASFDRIVMDVLWPEAHRQGTGTDWVNQHPICYLFLDKLMSLNHRQCLCGTNVNQFSKAYDAVQKIAAGEQS